MANLPLLALPRPNRFKARDGNQPQEQIKGTSADRQQARLGPKFDRLARTLPDPAALADLRNDPEAIVPERALVFEVAGTLVDFYRAMRSVGLELLGEDEEAIDPDADFSDKKTPAKKVHARLFFTIPDARALTELVRLWQRFQRGEHLGHGRASWKDVFSHLKDLRPWGPKDRLTNDAIQDWEDRLSRDPNAPVRFEVEFWYRNRAARRQTSDRTFRQALGQLGGQVIHSTEIPPIRYHALLAEAPARVIRELISLPESGFAAFDDVMVLRPQSVVGEPFDSEIEVPDEDTQERASPGQPPPIAALLDGLPMSQHRLLADRLLVDDPDDFSSFYGSVTELQHGTAMASLIIHGDLHEPHAPIDSPLYVRPIMYPQDTGYQQRQELMPLGQLGIDLMWRAFLRMFEGETGQEPTAPTVRIVNLSLGDAKRRFAGTMSPWARLMDYVAWRYRALLMISAGNILDPLPLEGVTTWQELEGAPSAHRQKHVLKSVLEHRASRRLLSPSESVNALTIGACHVDNLQGGGVGVMAVDPYESSYLPNPTSALGLGYHRAIKPELLFPGGCEHLRSHGNQAPIELHPIASPSGLFGLRAAAPGSRGRDSDMANHHGTSVATAMATHSAVRVLEALREAGDDPTLANPEEQFDSVVVKALLVHSGRWDEETVAALKDVINPNGDLHWSQERDEVTRFLGFGTPELDRVLDCTAQRATLVGWGNIHEKESVQYRVPLPPEMENLAGFRAVSITVAWLTPLNLSHRMYRMAKLTAFPAGDKKFSLGIDLIGSQPSHYAVDRGTVFHKNWDGSDAVPFVDNGYLVFSIDCKATAGNLDTGIPYGVAITIEVGQDIQIPVYHAVRERLGTDVAIEI